MTQEREALKLAFEFIERVNKDGWILADFEPHMYAVMTAIKEALAQTERPAPCARHCEANAFKIVIKNLKAQLAQTQEPVSNDPLPRACNLAGVDYQTFLKIKAYMPVAPPQPEPEPCDMKEMCIGCSPRNANGSCPDAPRKPLTDEQIDEIYFKSSLEVDNRCEDIYDFVRAIEAAHNIKE